MTKTLSPEALAAGLRALTGWSGDQSAISRSLSLPTFPAAIDLVAGVAQVAEELDHHPDIDIRWRTVTFTLSTHSEGGVTALDLDLAGRIDALAATGGVTGPS